MTDTAALPESLVEIQEAFLELGERDRLQLLLEFARELPDLPARYAAHPSLLEKVEECQSPVRAFAEVEADGVHFYATAPQEAPTTRGFASILSQGLTGLTPEQVLSVPDDFAMTIGLTRAVSPLRLHGMTGMLTRAKRQVREQLAAAQQA